MLLLSDFFLSGQTTHVLELAKQLQRLKVEVRIAFGTIHSKLFWSDYAPYLQEQKLSFTHGLDFYTLLAQSRRWRPDLIHAQSSTLFAKAKLLAAHLKIPYVVTCHGLGFSQPRYRQLLGQAAAAIAIGPKVAAEVAVFNPQVHIIPNGIDTELFCPPAGRQLRRREILYVGRLERKRLEPLRHLAKVHLELVGRPLKVISNWHPHLPGITFLPWQTNLVPHLQQSGIVAACGRTAREALSCGNAVLLVQQAYDGVVSPQLVQLSNFDFSGNLRRFSLADLKYDLRALLQRPRRLKKLQQWGRSYALTHLSSEKMARDTLAVYGEVVQGFTKPPE